MTRVYVLSEGQTEETFVREVLAPSFERQNLTLIPILVRTSRAGKGGVVRYEKIKPQILRLCREHPTEYVTTLFDYFRLPKDFPGFDSLPQTTDSFGKAAHLENALESDIGCRNFIPNLQVHEFEALLYSNPACFGEWYGNKAISRLQEERDQYPSPEHINDGLETAPSKRIRKICPGYDKVLHGSLIAIGIGLDAIRNECKHFNGWVERLERLQAIV